MITYEIPCLLGLEKLVADEIKRLGLADVRAENGRVLCQGSWADCARLNINLRCGARVIALLGQFPARSFEELFQGVRAIPWEEFLPREAAFPVKGYSISSQLHSVPACQSIIKKAVVERLKAHYGMDQFPETGTKYQIRFSVFKDQVSIGLDASGEGLYKRGYRAVDIARDNARKAGVDDCVRFEVADAAQFHRDSPYGQLVTNPPYGERLLERQEAEALYRAFGKAWRTLPAGWRTLVLSSHTEFERCFGKPADKKRKLYNGMIKCDVFMYGNV